MEQLIIYELHMSHWKLWSH